MSLLLRFVYVFFILLFLEACRQSEFLRKRYVDFNFSNEGFLSRSLLQTLGYASYKSAKRGSKRDKSLCLELAQREARKRLLRVLLHLYFDINSRDRFDKEKYKDSGAKRNFSRDYPVSFSEEELLQAELAFQPFLARAFIALQDSRDLKRCMVLYRVIGKDLPGEIRQAKLNFKLRQRIAP